MAVTPGTCIGPFEILSPLGAGGMGEVYRARDTRLNRDVALKLLPDSFVNDRDRLARFTREAQTLAALNHPNVAHIHGLEESDGVRALVMELVEGENLSQRISRGAMSLDDAVPIARQIAAGLEAAHEQGIVHRDLKPANIQVRADGTVKILDFGLAKAMDAAGSSGVSMAATITSPAMTQNGVILGTAAYMSPEQARGKPVDRRADIWAFGVVLFEMLSGERAFGGETISDTLALVLKSEPDWRALPPAVPQRLRALLKRCLDKEPTGRLQAIGEARIALATFNQPPDDPPLAAVSRPPRRWPWIAATAVLAAAVPLTWGLRPRVTAATPFTLEVAAPEGNTFAATDHRFVLSPDGERAVFIVQDSSGERQLGLRALQTGVVTTLPGTEGAGDPFWSPDSRWIGFFAAGQLKKSPIDGGRPQVLTPIVQGNSGTWSQDGTIVFSDPPKPLQRIAASGGAPREFLPLDESRHEILQTAPYFLPDGKHLLYDTRTSGAERGIAWASLDASERRFLIQNRNSPGSYALNPAGGDGWILYNNSGRLIAQPFSPTAGLLSGDPMTIADDVITGPTWSASATGMISFPHNPQIRRQLTWFLRNGTRQGTVGAVGSVRAPALSPVSKQVASERATATNRTDIWLFDDAQQSETKLTLDSSRAPIWTPDGNSVIHFTVKNATRFLIEHPMSGAAERVLKQFGNSDGRIPMAITADGRWISCTEGGGGDTHAIFVSRPEGNVIPFSEPRVAAVAISPDGRWVAYSATSNSRSEVFVQSSPKEISGTALAFKKQISTAGGGLPRWRPDGKELFYLTPEGKMMAVTVDSAADSFRNGTPQALFDAGDVPQEISVMFDVTADGQRFLVTSSVGQPQSPVTIILNWPELLKR